MPFAIGYVSLIGAALAMPTSLFTAPLGVRAAHAMSKRTLEMAFGCYLFIVGSRFVISLRGRAVSGLRRIALHARVIPAKAGIQYSSDD